MIWLCLLACNKNKDDTSATEIPYEPVFLESGSPIVGMSEGLLDFPIGSPMGGYSNRCGYLGGASKVDRRQSAYVEAFIPSVGVQTSAKGKALWLEAGNQHTVLLKADVIYSFDKLVEDVALHIEDSLGWESGSLEGQVSITASHTHHGPGNFSDQIHFYLGGDRYNEESYRRFRDSLVNIALEAYNTREEAAIGVSIHKDWDSEDLVYRDRRPENDDLAVWDDVEPGYGKDPYLWMLRVDKKDGTPMGMWFNFGIHGTLLGQDNPMLSGDVTTHIERALEDKFDSPIIVNHVQGAGGDATPSSESRLGHDYAQLEGIGERAVELIYDAWLNTNTSSESMTLEMVTQSAKQSLEDIRVTRNGDVDWTYQPFDKNYVPDDIIYDANGDIISPLDEFNAEFGAAFCGYDDPLVNAGTIGSRVYPYDGCMQVDLVMRIIFGVFDLGTYLGVEVDDFPLPLPSSQQASVSALRIGPVLLTDETGNESQDDILFGFFPGETTSMYAEQFRRRSKAELGFENAITVGYAQDHEGYLMIPEDWLVGGYEANINIWGPLQGEHIMEHALKIADSHLHTDEIERQDPNNEFPSTQYAERKLPNHIPDETPAAGTASSIVPENLWIPLDIEIETEPPTSLPRVQGLAQFLFEGGDPGVDMPMVYLEHNVDGEWIEVTHPSGRPITQADPDILITHLPTPLYPFVDPQSHHYWIAWQPIGDRENRMGLPLGEYRFHIYGKQFAGNDTEWPWDVDNYDLISPSFEVTEAQLRVSKIENEGGDLLHISLEGPEWGYRLVDMDGSSQGSNPPMGIEIQVTTTAGDTTVLTESPVLENGSLHIPFPEDAIEIQVLDMYGNTGRYLAEEE